MRRLLRQREIVADDWRYAGEPDADAAASLIVPLAQLLTDGDSLTQRVGKLGVRVGPATRLDEFVTHLPRLTLVAIEFPTPGDGRGYSLARLLRERSGFRGELRAVGAVKRDQVFFMSRVGFDSFELAAGEDFEAARSALNLYSVTYQPRGRYEPADPRAV
jgi:uncharacterized protein (DUF934 family)